MLKSILSALVIFLTGSAAAATGLVPYANSSASGIVPATINTTSIRESPVFGSKNLASRAFTTNLFATENGDAVYLNRPAKVLVVCKNQVAEECRTYQANNVVDAVPLQQKQRDVIVLMLSSGGQLICSGSSKGVLECVSAGSMDKIEGVRLVGSSSKSQMYEFNGAEKYTCTIRSFRYPTCNSARPVQSVAKNALLFGAFSGTSMSVLQIRGGVVQLCSLSAVGSTCHDTSGLSALLSPATRIAALNTREQEQSRIAVINTFSTSTCQLGSEGKYHFVCETENNQLSNAKSNAFVVTARSKTGVALSETLLFVPRAKSVIKESTRAAVLNETSISNRSFRNAYLRLLRQTNAKTLVANTGYQSNGEVSTNTCGDPVDDGIKPGSTDHAVTKSGDCDPGGGSSGGETFGGGYGAEYMQNIFSDSDGNVIGEDDVWTDSLDDPDVWDFESADFDSSNSTDRQSCYLICDSDKSARSDHCQSLAGFTFGAALVGTAGVSLLSIATGPGALAVAFSGVRASIEAAGAVAAGCEYVNYRKTTACKTVCDNGSSDGHEGGG